MPDTSPTKRFCPYLGAETDAEFSPDHIFPEMIGGKRDFMIEVSKERNSHLGSMIEQPGFDNFLFRAMRQSCGIKGKKGGIPNTVIEGEVTNASTLGLKYKLTKQSDGSILHELGNVKHSKMVDIPLEDGSGTLVEEVTVYEMGDDHRTFDRIMDAVSKRGQEITEVTEAIFHPEVNAIQEINLLRVQQSLAKILFGAACKWLEGYSQNDTQAKLLREFIFADDVEAAQSVLDDGLNCRAFAVPFKFIVPVGECQHSVVLSSSGKEILGSASVFGTEPWNFTCVVSNDSAAYGWSHQKVMMAFCDPGSSKTEIRLLEPEAQP